MADKPDDLNEGLAAMQELARSRAAVAARIKDAAEPLANAAFGLRRALGLDAELEIAAAERRRQARQDSQELRDSVVAAVESEKTDVSKAETTAGNNPKPETASERSFNVALAAYGATFGTGLLQIAAHDWYFGPIFTLGGGLGLMSIHPLIRSKLQIMRSNRSLWAMVAMTWLFLAANVGFIIYDHSVPHPLLAHGKLWAALTDDQGRSLERSLSKITNRLPILIICMSADCRELAGNFISAFHDAGWQVRGAFSAYPQEPVGLVLYQVDVKDRSLADAIEAATDLKIEEIQPTSLPNNVSLFVGIRP